MITCGLIQRRELLLPINTLVSVAVAELIPAPVGIAVAVIEVEPRIDGFQLQVAVIFGETPVVNLLIHPGIRKLFTLKVTRAGTVTATVMVSALPKEAEPLNFIAVMLDVSVRSLTVIVMA